MSASKLIFLSSLFSLVLSGSGHSQDFLHPLFADHTRGAHWEISGASAYIYSKVSSNWYTGGNLTLAYQNRVFMVGGLFNINQSQNFLFQPGRLIIEVDDANVVFTDSTRFKSRPDRYDINQPLSVFFGFRKKQWQFTAVFAALTQQSELEQPQPGVANDSLFFINWIPISKSNTYLLNTFVGRYTWENIQLNAGLLALSLVHAGDQEFEYEHRPKPRPFFGVNWNPRNSELAGFTDSKSLAVSLAQPVARLQYKGKPLRTAVYFQSGLESFKFYALRLRLDIPVSHNLRGSIGYDNVWSGQRHLNRSDFHKWQQANVFGALQSLNNSLPHQSLFLSLSWTIDRTEPPWPLQILNVRLFQKQIFTAKREFYANNPIATIDLYNDGDHPVECQISLETTSKVGTFKTETLRIHSKEMKTVPLYFYLGRHEFEALESSEQLIVSARLAERSRILAAESVKIYGRHAWDGNTWGLRYFVAPDDPFIKDKAKQVYLSVLSKTGSSPEPQAKLAQLRGFIEEFGKDLRYIADPTTSIAVDQVQYPVETLMKGSGDCEDLTVCLASGLMSVGINAAVVDVRPKLGEGLAFPAAELGSLGHVFILVDTGIAPEFMAEIGLTEFQAVTRKNALGEPTLWLPLEGTALSQGFDTAFKLGVMQYYQEIVEKNGVVSGNVHIYDF